MYSDTDTLEQLIKTNADTKKQTEQNSKMAQNILDAQAHQLAALQSVEDELDNEIRRQNSIKSRDAQLMPFDHKALLEGSQSSNEFSHQLLIERLKLMNSWLCENHQLISQFQSSSLQFEDLQLSKKEEHKIDMSNTLANSKGEGVEGIHQSIEDTIVNVLQSLTILDSQAAELCALSSQIDADISAKID